MFRLYRNYNHRFAYKRYTPRKYVRPMSWKGTILCIICIFFSKYTLSAVFDLNGGNGYMIAAVSLFYFINSLFIDYIFCKYTYFGFYQNIDEQARAGDWLGCFYFADSVLVLVGSIYAVLLFAGCWTLPAVRISFLVLLGVSIFMTIPVFQVTSKKTTLLWCILRVVIYGAAQRTGFLCMLVSGLCRI